MLTEWLKVKAAFFGGPTMSEGDDSNGNIGRAELLHAVATAVAGYFAANPMPLEKVDEVVKNFFRVFSAASGAQLLVVENRPAVPISESVTEDLITCLDCGLSMKSLGHHLRRTHKTSPEAYRKKWGLPDSYSMLSPAASALRSDTSRNVQEDLRKAGRPVGAHAHKRKRGDKRDSVSS